MVGFYPFPETTPVNKKAYEMPYRALFDSYICCVQMIDKPEELAFTRSPIVVIEERTNNPAQVNLVDFQHPERCTYIVGNSIYRWPSAKFDSIARVYIDTPAFDRPLYGSQAAAIVLQDRYQKCRYTTTLK